MVTADGGGHGIAVDLITVVIAPGAVIVEGTQLALLVTGTLVVTVSVSVEHVVLVSVVVSVEQLVVVTVKVTGGSVMVLQTEELDGGEK